jgi:uncharacterized protein (DUF849 family)
VRPEHDVRKPTSARPPVPWVQACLNGARAAHEHPALPLTPAALAADAAASVAAGARGIHLHARAGDGVESLAAADVGACVGAVRAAVPGVQVGVSTGLWITAGDVDRRAAAVSAWAGLDPAARPAVASVNLGEPGARELCRRLLDLGIGVEAGVWAPAELDVLAHLPRDGLVRVLLEVVGERGDDAPGRARDLLDAARRVLPAGSPLLLHGEDAGAWPVLALALRAGVPTRIGLEDALTGPSGEAVAGNADLVRAALRLSPSAA